MDKRHVGIAKLEDFVPVAKRFIVPRQLTRGLRTVFVTSTKRDFERRMTALNKGRCQQLNRFRICLQGLIELALFNAKVG